MQLLPNEIAMIKNKLEGLMLSIIDDTRIEDFCFTDNFVIATIGIKDGPICAPVLDYEIFPPKLVKTDYAIYPRFPWCSEEG